MTNWSELFAALYISLFVGACAGVGTLFIEFLWHAIFGEASNISGTLFLFFFVLTFVLWLFDVITIQVVR